MNNGIEFTFQFKHIKQSVQFMDHTSGAGSDGMKIRYLKQMMHCYHVLVF